MIVSLSKSRWFQLSTKALHYLVKKKSDTISFNFIPEFYGCSEWWRDSNDRWQECWRRDREKLIYLDSEFQYCQDREGYLYKNDSLIYYFNDFKSKWLRIHPDIIEVIRNLGTEAHVNGFEVYTQEINANPWDDWHIVIEDGKEKILVNERITL